MASAFNKDLRRSISNSWGRFLAIAIIAALGAGFYAGLRMTGPDMRLAGDEYYDGTNLSDIRVVSTIGLIDDEVGRLRGIEGVSGVMPAYEADAISDVDGVQYTLRYQSLDVDAARASSTDGSAVISSDSDFINRPILESGSWPSNASECLLSVDTVWQSDVQIGDTVRLIEGTQELDDTFSVREFTVCGFVRSSYYTCSTNTGSTSLGSGKLSSFVYVPNEAFADDYPCTEAFVTVSAARDESWGSDAYQSAVDEVSERIEAIADELSASRIEGIQAEAQATLDEKRADFEREKSGALDQIADGQAQLDSSKAQLDSAAAQLNQARSTLASSRAQYDSAMQTRADLESKLQEANNGIAQMDDALSQLDSGIAQIEAMLPVLDPSSAEYAQASAQLEALKQQKAQLESQKTQAQAGASQLQAGIEQIDSQTASAPAQLAEGEAQLASGQAEYDSGLAQWQQGADELASKRAEAESSFADAERQLADAQVEIDDLASTDADVYVLDLTKNVGAESFRSDSGRIDQIAQVFPMLFFLVAALVSLTTMTRMVDEERVLIGTFKALGYSNARIASKYLVYAAVASGVGSVAGIVLLSQFLPWFIMGAYSIIYAVPCRPTPIDAGMFILSAGLSVGITVAATLFAAMATLRERPASLMLPRAPKAGKRILLERVRPLWSRMSFSWKVTARNLFRYKRRFFMAVIGIAGCTGLLLVGLGLQNAINDIIDKQYGELYHYSAIVRMDSDATESQKQAVSQRVERDTQGGQAWVMTANKIVRAEGAGEDGEQRVELDVPQDAEGFGDFNTMRTRVGHEPLSLDGSGALVSEKLATKLGVSVGDSIVIFDEDAIGNATGEGRSVRIAGIMENYVAQYVLMSPDLYESVMGEEPAYATLFAKVGEGDSLREAFSDDLLAADGVKTVTYNDETIESYRSMLKSVDSVVVVLVVAAALLAFVVLYNLTNINITERVREIATLKVLGFTPGEVNAYIYRETLLLALIGALVGLALGVAMEGYVVVTAEVDQVMFGRDIHLLSFAIAFVLTMAFSVVVTIAMKGKLRRIDMVESLKSVE